MVDLGIKPDVFKRALCVAPDELNRLTSLKSDKDKIVIEKNDDDTYKIKVGVKDKESGHIYYKHIPKVSLWYLDYDQDEIDYYTNKNVPFSNPWTEYKQELTNIERLRLLDEQQLAEELVYAIFINALYLNEEKMGVVKPDYLSYIKMMKSWLLDEFQSGHSLPPFKDVHLFFDENNKHFLGLTYDYYNIRDVEGCYNVPINYVRDLIDDYIDCLNKCNELTKEYGEDAVNKESYQIFFTKRNLLKDFIEACGVEL